MCFSQVLVALCLGYSTIQASKAFKNWLNQIIVIVPKNRKIVNDRPTEIIEALNVCSCWMHQFVVIAILLVISIFLWQNLVPNLVSIANWAFVTNHEKIDTRHLVKDVRK